MLTKKANIRRMLQSDRKLDLTATTIEVNVLPSTQLNKKTLSP